MIHPFTLACAIFAVGAGAWAYNLKHDAQMLDRQINNTMKQVDETRARTGMLRAEYQLLNDPARLQDLADQVLTLKTTQPPQFARLADLAGRLPAVASARPAEPEPPAPAAPVPGPAPIASAIERSGMDRMASYQPVSSQPAPPAQPPIARTVARPVVAQAQPVVQQRLPAPRSQSPVAAAPQAITAFVPAGGGIERTALPAPGTSAPRPRAGAAAPAIAAPTPVMAASMAPAYRPARVEVPPATAAEAISRIARGGPMDPSVPMVASALGMARSMTPAAPIGSAHAAGYDPRTGIRN